MPRVRERYPGVPIVRDPEELLASPLVDAVIVSAPNTAHFDIARHALEKGKHVCVDYPMVQTEEEYDVLTGLARRQGVVLHDGLTSRIEEYHLAVKRSLTGIGQPLSAYYCYCLGKVGWYWQEDKSDFKFVLF